MAAQKALRRELGLDGDTAKVDEAREVRSSLARTRELMATGLASAGAALGALGDDDDALALLRGGTTAWRARPARRGAC